MTRKLKTLWLALGAILAFGALMTSGVLAGEEEEQGKPKRFTFGTAPVDITGEKGEFVFTADAGEGEVKCTNVHYDGISLEQDVPELTITPTNLGCSGLGFAKAHMSFEGCDYTFTLQAGIHKNKTGMDGNHTTGPTHIDCPEGKQIRMVTTLFNFPICELTIPPQTATEPIVDQKNITPGGGAVRFVRLTWTIKGLAYTVENGEGACGEEGGHFKGSLDGVIDVKAFEPEGEKKQVSFRISGEAAP